MGCLQSYRNHTPTPIPMFMYLHNPDDGETLSHFQPGYESVGLEFSKSGIENLLVFIFHCLHDTWAASFR